MSKSLGNVVAPQDVIKQYGADILRLWVAAGDYAEDQRLGKRSSTPRSTAIASSATRFAGCSAIAHYRPEDAVRVDEMPGWG